MTTTPVERRAPDGLDRVETEILMSGHALPEPPLSRDQTDSGGASLADQLRPLARVLLRQARAELRKRAQDLLEAA